MLSFDNPRLKRNNFDLLRLLFAGTVVLVHAAELSGYAQLKSITAYLSTSVAVRAFFVVSGFLIFMSFERSPTIRRYADKRVRRIYPAYFAVVVLCAVLLLFVSTKNPAGYFSLEWGKYLVANLTFLNFLQPSLPGVFDTNLSSAVNGALWTLKVEVMFYLLVPLVVFLFRKLGTMRVLVVLYVLSVFYAWGFSYAAESTERGLYAILGRQLPGQLSYFMAGAFFFYELAFFERHAQRFLGVAIIFLFVNAFWPVPLLEPFALATVVVYLGLFGFLGNFGRYGDFSYGTYILHFPIIQILLYLGWQANSPFLFLGSVVLLTLAGAFLLWHLVEKRFLSRRSHYVEAARSEGQSAG